MAENPLGPLEPWEGEPCEVEGLLLGVSRRWKDRASTSGDLGTIALYTLVKSLTDVRRELHGWLDDVEVDLLRHQQRDESFDPTALIALRTSIGHLARRVRALKTPSARESDSWFSELTDSTRAKDADEKLSRALEDLGRLSDRIRTTLDFLQFGVAQRQQQAAERLQRRFELVTAIFLVPALVAAVFGANTALPDRNGWVGFGLMLGLMVFSALASYALLRVHRRRVDS